MSKMGNYVLEQTEQFYEYANDIVNDAETLDEALKKVESLRATKFNFMDADEVATDTECAYYLK